MKKIFMFILIVLFLSGCSNEEGTITKITCNKMKEIMRDSKAVLLDVRSKDEYDEGHLDNAKNSPLTKLENLKKVDHLDSKTPIIVYCKSGVRSNDAAKELLKMGFINIYDLGAMSNCNS